MAPRVVRSLTIDFIKGLGFSNNSLTNNASTTGSQVESNNRMSHEHITLKGCCEQCCSQQRSELSEAGKELELLVYCLTRAAATILKKTAISATLQDEDGAGLLAAGWHAPPTPALL